jgi:hypothetical protein
MECPVGGERKRDPKRFSTCEENGKTHGRTIIMLAPYQDDPEGSRPLPGRRRHWRDLGLRAAAVACVLLAALFGLLALGMAVLK